MLFSDTVMDNIMTDWQIENSVAKINTNISKAASVRSMLDKIRIVLNHEQKVSSKGEETQFRKAYSELLVKGVSFPSELKKYKQPLKTTKNERSSSGNTG